MLFRSNLVLSGRVVHDTDGDGVFSAGDDGVNGVTVTITKPDLTTAVATTATVGGVAGSFSFTGLTPGAFSVVETDPSGYTSLSANTLTPTLVDADSPGNDFLDLFTDYSISGTVYSDLNGNGGVNAGDVGKGGITVTLTKADTTTTTTTTAGDGTYTFSGLAKGVYGVTYSVPTN